MHYDADLESAIDRAGRSQVFLEIIRLGWGDCVAPPKNVWWEAVRIVEMARERSLDL